MKIILSVIIVCVWLVSTNDVSAQTINWASLEKGDKHIANIYAGAEYAFELGASYGYHLPSKRPIILNTDFSIPAGNNVFDDYKIKTGAEIGWLHSHNFYVASRTQAVFRQYKTGYATLLNFGCDIAGTAGWYKQKWFGAAEIGFDKAIATHFKHSNLFKQNFPGIKDGWYEPSTGGNLYYGMQAGYTIHKTDIYLKAGKIIGQDFKTPPSLAVYAQLGINIRFVKK